MKAASAIQPNLRRLWRATFLFGFLASPVLANQFEECVGRYQLALPGIAQPATVTPRVVDRKYVEEPIQFPDGQPANLSTFRVNGRFEITRELTLAEYVAFKDVLKRRIDEAGRDNKDLLRIEMSTDRPHAYAYFGSASSGFSIYADGQMVTFRTAGYGDNAEAGKAKIQKILNGLAFRKDFEVPRGAGVCLPGVFVALEENDHRDVGVTYRLKEHPDVTILFKDKTSAKPIEMVDVHNMPVGRRTNLTSREQNEFVWKYSGLGRAVKLDHDPLPFQNVELDGRKGVSSFGTITRDDGTIDFAYLATVQGDPNAAVDTPDLMLLVQRTAKYAKGSPPVSKDELKKIAKDIAASVIRRPVQ
ncbi:hypothetical protein AWB75_02286 [Caballeronia catudaia]|uniref:Tle cognate immunity protein 4 C-terminal domain-containing protein n=1 Tax=Caballeronia catudaia TaxID=1777136 RepID=A0A158AJG7_9BURK|nr:T6SS immunity protein Tli4 family protein [Caballeronia catudaia]SAK57932.1 hypothetical protein AWB75_02286 [Caballeronia catudaia]